MSIWMAGKAVGVDISPRPYYVFGPLLFLVMLVPFTINGLAVREAFFVSFLGKLGVDADSAFACGFLFFVMTIVVALPGFAIICWEGVRRAPAVPDGDHGARHHAGERDDGAVGTGLVEDRAGPGQQRAAGVRVGPLPLQQMPVVEQHTEHGSGHRPQLVTGR